MCFMKLKHLSKPMQHTYLFLVIDTLAIAMNINL